MTLALQRKSSGWLELFTVYCPLLTMILVIRPDATLEQIEHVIERVRELGFTPHVSRGESRTIVGVIGDETKPGTENFSAIPGVEQVLAIMKPFKLASREFHKQDS